MLVQVLVLQDQWRLMLMKRIGVEEGFRSLFRFKDLGSVTLGLTLVLIMALIVDRPVIEAMATAPGYVKGLGNLLEPFGNSMFPIAGGFLAMVLCIGMGLSFAAGPMRRLFWSLSQLAALVSLSAIWTGLMIRFLKALLGRPRPAKYLEDGLYNWLPMQFQHLYVSMPSGHTATVFAIAFILSVFLPRYRLLIIAGASMVGAGRIMTLHHWPSDVLIGAVLGWFFARGVARMFVGPDRIFGMRLNKDFYLSNSWPHHVETVKRALKA